MMSAESRIIALGKFSEDLRPYLDYDVEELIENGDDVVITIYSMSHDFRIQRIRETFRNERIIRFAQCS